MVEHGKKDKEKREIERGAGEIKEFWKKKKRKRDR